MKFICSAGLNADTTAMISERIQNAIHLIVNPAVSVKMDTIEAMTASVINLKNARE
jgi:hypothetical protein